MSGLRVVICDDEPLATERLARMVAGLPDVELAGAYLDGEELLSEFKGGADVLLLDIEMPKLDGFDVAEALSRRDWTEADEAPLLIFVTAHSHFAADAFDSGAVDFLTKPVRLNRLERAIERARAAIEGRQARRRLTEVAAQLSDLKERHARAEDDSQLWLRSGPRLVPVQAADVDWVAAEGECVRFHCGGESYLERMSISSAEEKLRPFGFLRIHRSTIVNPQRIESLERTRWGAMQARLATGTELRVSKSYEAAVRQLVRRG